MPTPNTMKGTPNSPEEFGANTYLREAIANNEVDQQQVEELQTKPWKLLDFIDRYSTDNKTSIGKAIHEMYNLLDENDFDLMKKWKAKVERAEATGLEEELFNWERENQEPLQKLFAVVNGQRIEDAAADALGQKYNSSLLSVHLENAIREGELKRSDVASWLSKPWEILKFLDADNATLASYRGYFGDDIVHTLEQWRDYANSKEVQEDPKLLLKWENEKKTDVDRARNLVKIVHNELVDDLEVWDKTDESLKREKGLNAVESVLRKTKEFVWDDFSEHPEMSAGLVILSYLVYNRFLKGKRAGDFLLFGTAAFAGYSFMRDKFGFQPVDKIADIMEGFGLKAPADMLRTGVDTVSRGLFGAENEKTINGYYYEEFNYDGEDAPERIPFDFMMELSPKELLDGYDALHEWNKNKSEGDYIEGPAGEFVDRMSLKSDMPSWFEDMPVTEKAQLLLKVVDESMAYIAVQNGKEKSVSNGVNVLKSKYIDGSYYTNEAWDRMEAFQFYIDHKYADEVRKDPQLRNRLNRMWSGTQEFCVNMAKQVQNGSNMLTMKHVMFLEAADPDKFTAYKGPGITYDQMAEGLQKAWKDLWEENGIGTKMKDGSVELYKDLKGFFMDTVPTYWTDVWLGEVVNENTGQREGGLKDKLATGGAEVWMAAEEWYEEYGPYVDEALASGREYILVPLGQLGAALGLEAWEAVEMANDKLLEFKESILENLALRRSLATAQEQFDPATREMKITIQVNPEAQIQTGPETIKDIYNGLERNPARTYTLDVEYDIQDNVNNIVKRQAPQNASVSIASAGTEDTVELTISVPPTIAQAVNGQQQTLLRVVKGYFTVSAKTSTGNTVKGPTLEVDIPQ